MPPKYAREFLANLLLVWSLFLAGYAVGFVSASYIRGGW